MTTLHSTFKNSATIVPIHGRVKEQLKANEHIICDFDSADIWVKFTLKLDSVAKSLDSELDLKVDKDLNGTSFL
jgi:hypothetical protein